MGDALRWHSIWPWVEPTVEYGAFPSTSTDCPRISIVTPNYNYADLLDATIRSVILQQYPNLEYIVIDDGSTDHSMDVIRKYKAKLAYFEQQSNRGQYETINKGFAKATGEIFAWLNSDDIYMPWTLHAVAKAFADYPDIDWIVGAFSSTQHGVVHSPYPAGPIPQEMIRAGLYHDGPNGFGFIQQESCFWRRRLWEKAGELTTGLRFAADFELWTRFARHAKLYSVSTLLGGFCIRGNDNRSRANRDRYMADVSSVVTKLQADRSGPELTLANRLSRFARLRKHLGGRIASRLVPVRQLRGPVLRWDFMQSRYTIREESLF